MTRARVSVCIRTHRAAATAPGFVKAARMGFMRSRWLELPIMHNMMHTHTHTRSHNTRKVQSAILSLSRQNQHDNVVKGALFVREQSPAPHVLASAL